MALKYFTGMLHNNSIAINPDHVVYVSEHTKGHALIHSIQEGTLEVTDNYLEVVARLNEKD
jgi:F0F1-type ATP synthase epsilon subunit